MFMEKNIGVMHKSWQDFFEYHNGNSYPPPLTKSDDNSIYFCSTIGMWAISYITKQRSWKLPQLAFNQVSDINPLSNRKMFASYHHQA